MVKQIPLSQGKFAIVDDADYDWLMQWKWCYSKGYALRHDYANGTRKPILMHRVINDTPEGFYTDHINELKLDNRRCNLRTATSATNKANVTITSSNTSGYKGVSWDRERNKWAAYIKVDYKKKHLGRFHSLEAAAKAYDQAALYYFGEFAALNFPSERSAAAS